MALNNLGYRPWTGRKVAGATRAWVISNIGIRRAWQSRWLRRLLFFSWLPAAWFGAGFFLWEQWALHPEWHDEGLRNLRNLELQNIDQLAGILSQPPNVATTRHDIWAWLLQTFFRYPQGVIMVLMVGLIAPPLISQDVRSRAFLLYFSRPLLRVEYLLGKVVTLWFYLIMISTLPALALYVLGIFLSPNLDVLYFTWDLPLRILGASIVLMLPTASLALCISSLTQESRYASFAWFAIWILGWFTYWVLMVIQSLTQTTASNHITGWSHLSFYHTLGQVQRWVFGFATFRDSQTSAVVLVGITFVSLVVLMRRISAPMRV